MEIKTRNIGAEGLKFYIIEKGVEVARAYLYLLKNDLHDMPFGFMEDVYVNESKRGSGLGSKLVKSLIEEAKDRGCYKLICTSRYQKPEVHRLYGGMGFKDHGKEFRIDF